MDTSFTVLIILQFLIIAVHDWINIPGWVHGGRAQEVVGRQKLAWATIVNMIFPGLAVLFAIRYYQAPKPVYVLNYWLVYTAITVGSAVLMWWVPYVFGSSSQRLSDYVKMYEGTRHVLRVRKGDPGPNLPHIAFHVLFLSTLVLAVVLRFRSA
jgi:hypothetical protein